MVWIYHICTVIVGGLLFHNEKQFNDGTVIDYKTVFNKGVSMIISASVSSVHTCDTCSG